jgi:hypothetical protein
MDFHASAAKNQTIIPHTTFLKTSTKKIPDSPEKPPFPKRNPRKRPPMIEGGGGVITPPMKNAPNDGSNLKTDPPRYDSDQKPKQFHEKTLSYASIRTGQRARNLTLKQ